MGGSVGPPRPLLMSDNVLVWPTTSATEDAGSFLAATTTPSTSSMTAGVIFRALATGAAVACERLSEVTKIAVIPVSARTWRSSWARALPAAFNGGSLSALAVTSAWRTRTSVGVMAGLLPAAGDDERDRAQEDLDVGPQRPVRHVEVVDGRHLAQRDARGAEDLPVAGHPWRQ